MFVGVWKVDALWSRIQFLVWNGWRNSLFLAYGENGLWSLFLISWVEKIKFCSIFPRFWYVWIIYLAFWWTVCIKIIVKNYIWFHIVGWIPCVVLHRKNVVLQNILLHHYIWISYRLCISAHGDIPFGAIEKITCPGINMLFHALRERWGNTQYAWWHSQPLETCRSCEDQMPRSANTRHGQHLLPSWGHNMVLQAWGY